MDYLDEFLSGNSGGSTGSSDYLDDFLGVEPPKPSGILRRIGDQGIKLAQGVIGVPETAVGLADLVSNGYAGKAAEDAGIRFKDAKAILGEYLSPEQQAADREVNDAKGFFPTIGAMVRKPSTIVGGAMESAPSMLAGGVASRGIMAGLPYVAPKVAAQIAAAEAAPFVASQGARTLAQAAPIAAGAAGEGIVTAGQNAEQLRQETPDGLLTPEQSALMAGSGALTGLIGFGAGKVANRLGIGDVQTMLARGKLGAVGAEAEQAAANKGFLRKVGEGFASEGVLQELPQSYQEQVAQNLALGKPWDEGAAEAGAQGMMAGALMGGGANAASHFAEGARELPPATTAETEQQTQQDVQQAAQPLQLGRNPDAGALISYPDGSVAYRSEVESYIDSLPEDQKPAAMARFMGYAPQPAEQATNPDINPDEPGYNPDETAEQPQLQPVATPSQEAGIDPNYGPMSRAATAAMDIGHETGQSAHQIAKQQVAIEQQQEANKGKAEPQQPQAPTLTQAAQSIDSEAEGTLPVAQAEQSAAGNAFADWTDEQLRQQLHGARSPDIRNILATELEQRRDQAAQAEQPVQVEAVQPPTEEQALPPAATQEQATQQQQPESVPAYDSRPVEQRAEILQQVPGLVANSGDLNIIGKAMLNRPLEQMPAAVQQSIGQILTPPSQEQTNGTQTPEAIAPEAQQPPQQPAAQQVAPTYPAQSTTLDASQQQASAGPAYDAQGIASLLPAKTPPQDTSTRVAPSWDAQTPEQKTEALKRAGYVTNAGELNIIGKNLLTKAWDGISQANQSRIAQNTGTARAQGDTVQNQAVAPVDRAGTSTETIAPTAITQGQQSVQPESSGQGAGGTQPTQTATPAPAENQTALDRIASGKAWFSNALKAGNWLHTNKLADTHEVKKTQPQRFEIVPKAQQQAIPVEEPATLTEVIERNQAEKAAAAQSQQPDELLGKLSTGYGYPGGADTMPAGLGTTARKLHAAIISADVAKTQEILHPDNKRSREAFEKLFDGRVKLPKTVKGTNDTVADFLGKVSAAQRQAGVAATEDSSAPENNQLPFSKPDLIQEIRALGVTAESQITQAENELKYGDDRFARVLLSDSRRKIRLGLAKTPGKSPAHSPAAETENKPAAQPKPMSVPEKLRAKREADLAAQQSLNELRAKAIEIADSLDDRYPDPAAEEKLAAIRDQIQQIKGTTNNPSMTEESWKTLLDGGQERLAKLEALQINAGQNSWAYDKDIANARKALEDYKSAYGRAHADKQAQSTLDKALNDLREVRAKLEAQGMATDDRLERTASQLEKVVKELEAQENGQNDEMDAEMRSYERKAEQKKPSNLKEAIEKRQADIREQSLENAQNNADTGIGIKKEAQNDTAQQGSTPTLNHPMDEGQQPAGSQSPARGAKPARSGEGRRDDGGVHGRVRQSANHGIDEQNGVRGARSSDQHGQDGSVAGDSVQLSSDDRTTSGYGGITNEIRGINRSQHEVRRGIDEGAGSGSVTNGALVQKATSGDLRGDAGRDESGKSKHEARGRTSDGAGSAGNDFTPAIGGLTREGSWFDTAKRNIDLIELAIKIESENRPATPEEQAQLSKYVGFGAGAIRNELFPVPPEYAKRQEPNRLIWPNYVRNARFKPLAERIEALPREWQQSILQSSQYAHYTSEGIIRSVWSGLQRMGFTGGNVFEPGMGIGSFAMLMPNTVRQTSRYTGVEFDAPTALIARLLSPQQHMLHGDFIKRKFPKNFFDVNVGNPPFSQTKIFGDPEYEKHGFMLHDFFFAKGIDLVRPGGIQVFVTSKGTMDKQNDKARKYLAERADLLGAVRLPSTAFEDNAGTSVVTDVIFLRKRAPGEEPAGHAWGSVATVETKDGPVVVNEYFAAHPEMVLGQQRISGNTDDMGRRINSNGMGGERYTVVSYDSTPAELDAKFAKAIENLPENAYSVMSQSPDAIKAETAKIDFDPSVKREGVVYLAQDGTLMKVEHGVGKPLADKMKLSAKDAAWFKDYVGLRDLVQESRFAQVNDGDWESGLKKLNKAYDAFRKQHGPILNYRVATYKSTDEDGNVVETQTRIYKNKRLFGQDYDSSLMTSLEDVTDDGEIIKMPFLLGRTIGKPVTRDVRTIGDALAVSLDSTGKLNLDDVANRMHISRDEALEALGNQIYQTPDGQWQLADEYLSGNVVQKLDEAEEAARLKPELQRNVEALKQVQPEKLGPSQISAKLGASWIPVAHVNEFAAEIGAGKVTFDPKTETWQVEGGNLRSQRKASAEYGTADRSPSELLEVILNSRPIKITAKTADGKTVTNNEATTAANEAAKKIKDKFKGWVWTDTNRASELVEIYNKRYNNIAPRKFDGSHLTLPGVSLRYKLHPHQLRAIWRIIQTGNTYLAHAVGAGKTIEMIAAGMEQKRLGLIKKPIYAVPNHMLEQFSNEFMELYPLANIMVADDQNFSADKRKAFIAAATLNNPDAIIITHDAFQSIGVKEESIAPIRDEILTDLELELSSMAKDQGARVRRSQLEQQIEAVKQRFDRILGAGGKDATIKFEDMGVDFVFMDEAHAVRKLDYQTSQQIKGIDPNGSKRALDMYIKTRILDGKNPGRSMVFASGTPVTNTMGELYTIMRFFAAHQMDVDGISTFDAWSRQFGEVAPALEPNAAGKYEMVERFAKFDNVPELMSRVRQFMDVLTSDNLGALIKRPDLVGGKPNMNIISMSQSLKDYMKNVLAPRIEVSKKWKPTRDEPFNHDPILKIISDGRFAAIDPRFFGGELGEGETSIINEMGDKITANYHATKDNVYLDKDGKPEPVKGSTQIVFYNNGYGASAKDSRGFDARAALTKRLTAGGIPRNEIAWFDDADTDAKKEAIFKDMRSGKLKVLIGSAKKMGTGVNVQKRLAVLHYQDPPWYPADVEQPHGRIIRQGNQNPEVKIEWYTTKGTYQSTMWQMVGRKQRFIDQAFTGDKNLRSMGDMGEASMFEQAAAVASGDPRAIQLAGLRQDVERFERLQAAHASEQINIRSSLRSQEWNVQALNNRINTLSKAFKAIGEKFVSFVDTQGKVNGVVYSKPGEFGQALKDAFNKVAADSVMDGGKRIIDKQIASLGNAVTVTMDSSLDRHNKADGSFYLMVNVGETSLQVAHSVAFGADVDATGLARRVLNQVNSIDSDLQKSRRELVEAETERTKLRKKSGAPFEYQQDLAEKYGELKRLEAELKAEGEATQDQPTNVAINADGDIVTGKQASEGDAGITVFRATGLVGIWSQPVSHESVKGTVAAILKRIPNAPHVEVYRTPSDAGISISDPMPKGGTLPDGRIVIFSDANTGTLDVMRTVFHELFHRGLKSYFQTNADYVNFMLDLSAKNSVVRVGAMNWRSSIDGTAKWNEFEKQGPMIGDRLANYEALAVEESLAKMSETLRAGNPLQVRTWTRGIANVLERIARFLNIGALADWIHGLNNTAVDDFVNQMIARSGNQPVHGTTSLLLRSGSTFSTAANKAANTLSSFVSHPGTVSGWWKTVGSMYGLAQKHPEFKPVFDAGQRFLNDVSFYATEAANLAPTLLPKLETFRDIAKVAIPSSDNRPLADALFQGTLSWKRDAAGKLEQTDKIDEAGVVFTDAELKNTFGMNDRQVGLYHEARAAIDNSLDNTAKAAMVQLGGKALKHMSDMVMAAPNAGDAARLLIQELQQLEQDNPDESVSFQKSASAIMEVASKIEKLKANGYAPLSRFGRYTVDVVVNGKREYYGMFESKHDSNRVAEKMRSLHGAASVEQGTMTQKEFEQYQGITPETAELFGEMLGLDNSGPAAKEAFQEYLRLVKNNRSAMKRLIHRKGILGYHEDVGRVLSAFIASNSRKGSSDLNLGDMSVAVNAIPQKQGELRDIAIGLQKYLTNPQEESQAIRGMLFAQYIGGSVASAMINLTQPMTVSMPYLSQFGGAKKATAALVSAYKDMASKQFKYPPALEQALKVADEQGIIAPQEIHQLQAQARGAATLRSGDGTTAGNAIAMARNGLTRVMLGWGKFFGLAEQLNRRATFVAAYRLAQEQGIQNPSAFAAKAVHETQFVNNKGNRMHFGRGPIGSVAMTFKSYGLNYLELLHRMATQKENSAEGKQAALVMLGMLVLMSGAGGLPFEEDVMDVVDALAQRLGYNFSSKKAKQQLLEDAFGKAGADFIDKGITGLPGMPIDVSMRMGMANMIPGTGLLLQKRDHTRDLLELVGPAGDFGKRLFDAAGSLADGEVGSAIKTAAPKAIGNAWQGASMLDKGYYTDTRGRKVMDTTTGEAVAKMIGFQPGAVARDSEATGLVQRMKDVRAINASKFAEMWASGIYEKDPQQVQEAREAIKAWNGKNPDTRIVPNIPAILRRVREMHKTRDQRIIDSSPKAMRAGIRRELAAAG